MSDAENTFEEGVGVVPTGYSYAHAFSDEIAPAKVSVFYQLGLAVVAFAMVLLPAIYLGLIGLTGYGIVFHATHHTSILYSGGGSLGRALVYFGPILIGIILVVFMVKPFFARQAGGHETYSLSHTDQPQLFAFIGRICQLVNAPLPSRIDVDCQVNASASFRQGFASLFSNDVVLTIGLPLVAGLNMRQFAGVLAHEFGHFAQGAGMRLTYLIRHINLWFARVVYERDAWDVHLTQAARATDFRIAIVLHFARLSIWLTRRILWVLMHIGHAISCFMLRQMEYDADGCMARVTGSTTCREVSWRLQELNVASQGAYHQLQQSWKNKRLADDLPGLISHESGRLPDEVRNALREGFTNRKTAIFDTHPSDSDRIRAAELLAEPGVFAVDEPATRLFNDFPALSKAVTRFHYLRNLELPLTDANLVDNDEVLQEGSANLQSAQAANQYLAGLDLLLSPVILNEEEVVANVEPQVVADQIVAARELLAAQRDLAGPVTKELGEADGKALTAGVVLYLIRGGFQVKAAEFGMRDSSESAARQMSLEAEARRRRALEQLAPVVTAARQRLTAALQLLRHPAMSASFADATALQAEANVLLKTILCLNDLLEPFREIRQKHAAFVALLQHRDPNNDVSRLDQQLDRIAPDLSRLVSANLSHTQRVPYPFPHARGQVTVADYARHEGGGGHRWECAMHESGTHLDRMYSLYLRVFGRLVVIAEQVERSALGEPQAQPAAVVANPK